MGAHSPAWRLAECWWWPLDASTWHGEPAQPCALAWAGVTAPGLVSWPRRLLTCCITTALVSWRSSLLQPQGAGTLPCPLRPWPAGTQPLAMGVWERALAGGTSLSLGGGDVGRPSMRWLGTLQQSCLQTSHPVPFKEMGPHEHL